MKAFNLYYKNIRINNNPLSKEELDNVLKQQYIYKQNNKDLIKIDTRLIKIINTIVI